MTDIRIEVGTTLEQAGQRFIKAWKQAEAGERVAPARVLSFESWEALASVLTGERYKLLRHLHGHQEPSVSALARSLGRNLRRVQEDVKALEGAGLIERGEGVVRTTADRLEAVIAL